MADPSPVAQTFLWTKIYVNIFFLDAVVTVVDAKHIDQNLTEIKKLKIKLDSLMLSY